MSLVLALVASALIHAAALLGPGWTLPGAGEPEPASTIDAVLVKPVAHPEPAPIPKPAAKLPVHKPRPQAVAAAAPAAAITVAPSVDYAPSALPVESSPVAVTQAPTVAPAVVPAAPEPVKIALPAKGRVRYVITRGEGGFVVGQSVHTWQHDGFNYKLQSVTETTGLAAIFKPARVVMTSEGEVTAAGLKPHEFRHERVVGVDTAHFDWTRGVVAYAGREDPVVAGTQDMLSMYYQLVLLAPRSGTLDVPIATGRKVETYRFDVLGDEVVTLPAGQRRAWHLKTGSGQDSVELWIADDSRALPLKIRFTDRKGEIFDQLADDSDLQEKQ